MKAAAIAAGVVTALFTAAFLASAFLAIWATSADMQSRLTDQAFLTAFLGMLSGILAAFLWSEAKS